MIQRALILDTETTDLDPSKGSLIEIGAILYSVTHRTSLIQYSTLLPADSNPAERINRIPAAALEDVPPTASLLKDLFRWADVTVCHNAEFDRKWFNGEYLDKPWLCTQSDFRWPLATKDGGSLVHLALDHGIGVSSAHRALSDCMLIAALFDRMDDLQSMFVYAMRPKGIFQALVSYDDREKAKVAGFKWDGDRKRWTRRMAIEDAAALPFRTLQLHEESAA